MNEYSLKIGNCHPASLDLDEPFNVLILRNNNGKSCKNLVLEDFCSLVTFLRFVFKLFFSVSVVLQNILRGYMCDS